MASKNNKKLKESQLSPEDVDQYIPTPPDGGYGWVVVLASFCNHIIVDGIAFTFGVFYEDFLDYFDAGSGKTALVGSLLSGFYLITGLYTVVLCPMFTCRRQQLTILFRNKWFCIFLKYSYVGQCHEKLCSNSVYCFLDDVTLEIKLSYICVMTRVWCVIELWSCDCDMISCTWCVIESDPYKWPGHTTLQRW